MPDPLAISSWPRNLLNGGLAALLALAIAGQLERPAAASAAQPSPGTVVPPILPPGYHPTPLLPGGAVTVSPQPGSRTADPLTQISFLGRSLARLGKIVVSGSQSGVHGGSLRAYASEPGASFVPAKPFDAGEIVTVRTALPIAGADAGVFSFTVAHSVTLQAQANPVQANTGVAGVAHFASAPAIEPPMVTVLHVDQAPAGGDFFLAPKGNVGQPGAMIASSSGQLVWFHPAPKKQLIFDFRVQHLAGAPVLTWFQGKVVQGHGVGEGIVMNDRYQIVARVHAGNGTDMDLHEFQLTPQGTALITAYRTMRWDLSAVGGSTKGTVFDGVVQQIDLKTGLVMEEWDSLDHVPVTASDFRAPKASSSYYDYFHINGIQALGDGYLLVSSRNTSAAYEVNPADDGAIVLTLGGKQPSVTMGAGATFWFQHDVELHPGRLFTIFDNASSPAKAPASRALFLRYSQAQNAVTVLHATTHPGVLAYALGNVQLLAGGNYVVGWGSAPFYSQYSSTGALLYEARMPAGDNSYRTYRFPWSATPAAPPTLSASRRSASLALQMCWNGATVVESWRILAGKTASSLRDVATVAATGFEAAASIAGAASYVEAQALDSSGQVLASSALQRVP